MSHSPHSTSSRPWGGVGIGAAIVGACLVCCAAPVLSILGAIAALSAVAAVWIPALAVLAVVALAVGIGVWRSRRRAACARPAEPVDLGMPVRTAPALETTDVSPEPAQRPRRW